MVARNRNVYNAWVRWLNYGYNVCLPKLTEKIPAALTAIIVVACITIFGGIEVGTVGQFIKDGGGSGLARWFTYFSISNF